MNCRRICQELLWLARFGEFGPSSQPHLDHLAACRSCRDEVGFDRAMVEQLRIALAERVEGAAPSSLAFERILARAQDPEPQAAVRIWEWSTAFMARLRFATAMAGTGLALVLALNMNIVPTLAPATADAASSVEEVTLQTVPRVPPEPDPLARIVRQWGGGAAQPSRDDPEHIMTTVRAPQERVVVTEEPAETMLRLVVRPMQTPDPGSGAPLATAAGSVGSSTQAEMPVGEPS